MLKKLKSVLKNHRALFLILGLRAAVFSLFLYLSSLSAGYFFIFIPVAFYFYFFPFLNTRQFFSFFAVLISVAILSLNVFVQFAWELAILWGICFYLFIGVKNHLFIKREPLFYFLSGVLAFFTFIIFFNSNKSGIFPLGYIFSGLAIFIIFRQFLKFIFKEKEAETLVPKHVNLISVSFSLLIIEAIWAISLLPIGFLNSSALSLLIVLILKDLTVSHINGILNRKFVLISATAFLLLSIAIFAASNWTI